MQSFLSKPVVFSCDQCADAVFESRPKAMEHFVEKHLREYALKKETARQVRDGILSECLEITKSQGFDFAVNPVDLVEKLTSEIITLRAEKIDRIVDVAKSDRQRLKTISKPLNRISTKKSLKSKMRAVQPRENTKRRFQF